MLKRRSTIEQIYLSQIVQFRLSVLTETQHKQMNQFRNNVTQVFSNTIEHSWFRREQDNLIMHAEYAKQKKGWGKKWIRTGTKTRLPRAVTCARFDCWVDPILHSHDQDVSSWHDTLLNFFFSFSFSFVSLMYNPHQYCYSLL